MSQVHSLWCQFEWANLASSKKKIKLLKYKNLIDNEKLNIEIKLIVYYTQTFFFEIFIISYIFLRVLYKVVD
jgi:hypothetical protein